MAIGLGWHLEGSGFKSARGPSFFGIKFLEEQLKRSFNISDQVYPVPTSGHYGRERTVADSQVGGPGFESPHFFAFFKSFSQRFKPVINHAPDVQAPVAQWMRGLSKKHPSLGGLRTGSNLGPGSQLWWL